MMNSVHSLPTNLPTEFIPSVIPLVKMTCHHFFLLCFNFFPTVIPSVFPFVFINFLVVISLGFNLVFTFILWIYFVFDGKVRIIFWRFWRLTKFLKCLDRRWSHIYVNIPFFRIQEINGWWYKTCTCKTIFWVRFWDLLMIKSMTFNKRLQ